MKQVFEFEFGCNFGILESEEIYNIYLAIPGISDHLKIQVGDFMQFFIWVDMLVGLSAGTEATGGGVDGNLIEDVLLILGGRRRAN